jgi:uncharacterized membrane protein YeaQ/YmgE (transglycosylase-associated protein family)
VTGDRTILRSRRWYVRLVRLYPAPFRARFGAGMVQTFTDLCRERRRAGASLLPLVVWLSIEAVAGSIKEHVMRRDRPLGITLLAILAVVGALVLLFAARIWIVVEEVQGAHLATAVAVALLAVVYLAFAVAAWFVHPVGWALGVATGIGTIAVLAVMLLQSMTNMIDEAPMLEIIAGGFIGVAIVGLLILRRADVRAAFGRA